MLRLDGLTRMVAPFIRVAQVPAILPTPRNRQGTTEGSRELTKFIAGVD